MRIHNYSQIGIPVGINQLDATELPGIKKPGTVFHRFSEKRNRGGTTSIDSDKPTDTESPDPKLDLTGLYAAALTSGDKRTKRAALQGLESASSGATKDSIPSLIKALNSDDVRTKLTALEILNKIGKDAKDAVPALINTLSDRDCRVRYATANILGAIGEEAKDAVPALIKTLKDDDYVRNCAYYALTEIGEAALPELIKASKSRNEMVRSYAVQALGREQYADRFVPLLAKAAGDESSIVRVAAVEALAEIGKKAQGAIPELIKALKDKGEGIQENAAKALRKIGKDAKRAIPALRRALKNTGCMEVILALMEMGSEAKTAIPELIWVLNNDEDHYTRRAAINALNSFGVDATVAIPDLIRAALRDDNCINRASSAHALGNLGVHAKEAVPYLKILFEDEYEIARVRAVEAVCKIKMNVDYDEMIMKMTWGSGNDKEDGQLKDSWTCTVAIKALGEVGRDIPKVTKHLRRLIEYYNRIGSYHCRNEIEAAEQAIKKIQIRPSAN